MSPVALDQDPRKANPTPRGGGRVTARPVFARSFFLAESDPAVLLSCQIFLHAQQIALPGTLNNPQQLSHRGDLLQLLPNEPLKEIVGRIIGLSLCHGHERIDLACDLLFLFERKLYRVFSHFEVRLWRGHSGKEHALRFIQFVLDTGARVNSIALNSLPICSLIAATIF
jgi:hypothetical protein